MKLKFLTSKWIVVFLHVALWALFVSYPYIIRQSFGDQHPGGRKTNIYLEIHSLISFITWISLFYVNAYLLMPLFFNKKKFDKYGLVILFTFLVLFCINYLSFSALMPGTKFKIAGSILFYLIPSFFVLIWSIAYRIWIDKVKEDKIKVERQTENLKTELSFLRSQVSPHFMFNVMNNMVALARKKSDLLEPSLIKLSSLLRYMLYETDEEKVSVRKEIDYLQSYIDLQKQRFADNVIINVLLDDVNDQYQIHPMLLIPFVENAFKHGTGMFTPEIDIRLRMDDRRLFLDVQNRYNDNGIEVRDRSSGIGLANVQRRLNLLYGNNHRLDIIKENNRFTVSLEILL